MKETKSREQYSPAGVLCFFQREQNAIDGFRAVKDNDLRSGSMNLDRRADNSTADCSCAGKMQGSSVNFNVNFDYKKYLYIST